MGWLLLASVVFYAWSNTTALATLVASILLNYGFARWIANLRTMDAPRAGWAVGFAIATNLGILVQFKYLEFFVEAGAALVGIELPLVQSIPPLAISFFTFQQIAYLVDVHRGHAAEQNVFRYGLFVSFFPQLIAGPIVHHKDMLPQFSRAHQASNPGNISVGTALFSIGLFKKVVIADGIVDWVTPVFASSAAASLTAAEAWLGTLAYTLQLYFDFSGYCDMAIGLGLMFGFRLPLNFNSPYQAVSIVDFWRRWHQTLSRFLRDYLYFGLGGNRRGPARRYVNLLITMLLGGLWHGASWTFLAWGAFHGLLLMLNHLFRACFARVGREVPDTWSWRAGYRLATVVSVMVAWVFFRADSIESAVGLISIMFGVDATSLAELTEASSVLSPSLLFDWHQVAVLLGLLGIVSFAPNSQTIVGYTGVKDDVDLSDRIADEPLRLTTNNEKSKQWAIASTRYVRSLMIWRPSFSWAVVTALLCLISLASMSEARDFVYFRF